MNRASLLSLLGLMVAGAVVRIAGLGEFYLSPDEATIMAISREPSLAAVFHGTLAQAHPPFHFFLMHFWPDPGKSIMALRVSSLIPGLLFIPACYFLGKRALGPWSAWVMAFLAAFGTAPMTLSEVIRPYALVGLLLVAALWCWLDYLERPRAQTAAGYAAGITAALCFHYSAGLFIAGAGLAGAAWLLYRRQYRDLVGFCVSHIPAAAAGIALYFLHLARIPELQRSWMDGYLSIGFPQSARDLVHHFNTILMYFFVEPLAPVFTVLCLGGVAALILRRRWPALLFIAANLAVALALNLTGVYPLYGLRHSFWLFPAFALLAAAPIELLDGFLAKFSDRSGRIFSSAPATVLPVAVLVVLLYGHFDYLRPFHPTREAEFAMTKTFFNGVLAWFDQKTAPNDLILTTLQTADLLRFSAGPGAERKISPRLSALNLHGRDYIYDPQIWNYRDRGQLSASLRDALNHHPTPTGSSVIILNVGYGCESVLFAASNLFRGNIASAERTTDDYLFILRLPADEVRKTME